MLKFKGFRASLNFSTGKRTSSDYTEDVTVVSVNGAYRVNREEFYGSGSYADPPKKITPSMVKLPPAFQPDPTDPDVIKAAKSTGDLTAPNKSSLLSPNVPVNLRKSTPNVSADPRGGTTNKRDSTNITNASTKGNKTQGKEQKKSDKKMLVEQKKRDKLAAQEQAKEEKLRKEREKAELLEQAKAEKLRKEKEKSEAQKQAKEEKLRIQQEKVARQPKEGKPKRDKSKQRARKPANPLAQTTEPVQSTATTSHSTNTLESSISKSSGPPPYSEVTKTPNSSIVVNESDDTGNTSFGKPLESSDTWDMIAQHRQQLTRAPVAGKRNKIILRLQQTDNNDAVTGRKSVYI